MYIDKNGDKWFKGNLHTHTTNSDGAISPSEAIALYQKNGYDFIALTDHWKLYDGKESDKFLILSGCEYNIGDNVQDGIFHFVGIGIDTYSELENTSKLKSQDIIDYIHKAGGMAILAHPAWSLNRPEDVLQWNNLDAVEIYNSVSGRPWNARPYSGCFIDALAVESKIIPCVASDDAHFYNGDQCYSYIMVRAEDLSYHSIMQALKNGDFYATQGPNFSVTRINNTIHVTCTPVEEIVFFSDTVFVSDRVTHGNNICEAFYTIKPSDSFVRIELFDKNGRMAWSSPIWVK